MIELFALALQAASVPPGQTPDEAMAGMRRQIDNLLMLTEAVRDMGGPSAASRQTLLSLPQSAANIWTMCSLIALTRADATGSVAAQVDRAMAHCADDRARFADSARVAKSLRLTIPSDQLSVTIVEARVRALVRAQIEFRMSHGEPARIRESE